MVERENTEKGRRIYIVCVKVLIFCNTRCVTVKCGKTNCHEEGVAVSFWYRSHYNEEAWYILCSHMLCVGFEMCGTAILCEYTSIKRILYCCVPDHHLPKRCDLNPPCSLCLSLYLS